MAQRAGGGAGNKGPEGSSMAGPQRDLDVPGAEMRVGHLVEHSRQLRLGSGSNGSPRLVVSGQAVWGLCRSREKAWKLEPDKCR